MLIISDPVQQLIVDREILKDFDAARDLTIVAQQRGDKLTDLMPVAFQVIDHHIKVLWSAFYLHLLGKHALSSTEVTEEDIMTFLTEHLLLFEAGEPFHRLVERGNSAFPVYGEDTDAEVFQKLAELRVKNICFRRR
jgi:hypothetical protein